MLRRSPRAKLVTISIWALVAISLFIGLDSLITFRSLSNSYGNRKKYLVANVNLLQGSPIKVTDLGIREFFSKDAPKGALESSLIHHEIFAKISIPKGSILTSSMVSKTTTDTIDDENRIMFVPSKERLNNSIGSFADLIYVSPDGYGSEIVAYKARILFDVGSSKRENGSQEQYPGYFVEITSQEAQDLTTALASSDVRFALIRNSD